MPLDGQQLGRYRLLNLLGRGAMGEVYLAEDVGVNRQVAIKVIRTDIFLDSDTGTATEAARLFQNEMKTIARLNHLHILPLFDYGEQVVNGTPLPYMVMPFCQDGSLASWWREYQHAAPISPADVAFLIQQAADALQYAHNQQIIHRDVKPSNFLIRSHKEHPNRPDLLLADFGLARLSSSNSTLTQGLRGTPAYMAPEQWESQPVPATDQYALAIMAYQFLTGHPPFQGRLEQLMVQHVTGQAQLPSTINPRLSPALDAVLLRALAKHPEDRYPDVSAFARAFQAAVQNMSSASDSSHATVDSSNVNALSDINAPQTPPRAQQGRALEQAGTSGDRFSRYGDQGERTQADQSTRGLNFSLAATRNGFRCSVVLLLLVLFVVGGTTLLTTVTRGPTASNTISSRATPTSALATTTTVASQNPYPPGGGTLALNDPLSDNSKGYNWDTKPTSFGTCSFTEGTYHAAAPGSGTFHSCAAQNTNFSNFAYEVDMTIIAGNCGGIIFRADFTNRHYYLFSICQDGSYQLRLYTQPEGPETKILLQGSNPNIRTGLGQSNLVAVVVNNDAITLYVNHQFINSVQDNTYSQGQIGVAADNNNSPTEVAFRNAKVWAL